MSGPATLFREIHRLRRSAQDIKDQLDRFPRQLKAQQARVARQEELQREGQDRIKHLKVGIHDKEVTLKTTHGQIKKYEKQLDEAAGKKEYDALQLEIATAKAKCQSLEDEILTDMTTMEETTAQLPELERAVQQAREEYKQFEATSGEKRAELTKQLTETLARLKEAEAGIPGSIRPQYDRMVAAMGADAMACARNRICLACSTEITTQNHHELLQHNFVVCKACGRILYPPEEVVRAE
jgi:predicted  nucleic acid-binding Zn-ribbon protein